METSNNPVARAEFDLQIDKAKQYPRDIAEFRKVSLALATADEEIASTMFYKLKRSDKSGEVKFIEGPSVRLAEIVATTWKNMRVAVRQVGQVGPNDRSLTVEAACHDLESNVAVSIQISRNITTRSGHQYSQDMIGVTQAAAVAVAYRNAVFKVVPGAFVQEILNAAKRRAVGGAAPIEERRRRAVDYFVTNYGIHEQRVLAAIGRESIDDVTVEDLATLVGMYNAIKEGTTTIEEQFELSEKDAQSRAEQVLEKMGGRNAGVSGGDRGGDAGTGSKGKKGDSSPRGGKKSGGQDQESEVADG